MDGFKSAGELIQRSGGPDRFADLAVFTGPVQEQLRELRDFLGGRAGSILSLDDYNAATLMIKEISRTVSAMAKLIPKVIDGQGGAI